MKKLLIIFVCLLMILSTNSKCQELENYHRIQAYHFGLKEQFQIDTKGFHWANSKYLISKPGHSKYYEWDNQWQNIYNSDFTYNDKGILIEEERNIMVVGDSKYKFFWIYDNHDNLIEYTVHHWINKNWEVYSSQIIYITYDESGNVLEMMSQILEDEVWINLWKTEYELGIQGEWIKYTEYIWENEMWINDLKYIDIVWYSWINDQLESYIVQTWDEGWVNSDKYSMTYNQNFYGGIWEKYDGENWLLYERKTFTFNQFEEVDLYERYENGIWINSEKYSLSFDDLGSITRYTYEFWEDNNWSIDADVKFLLTYNVNNDLTEEIVQLWDNTYNLWYNIQRFVNYNFQYFEMGLAEDDFESQINIYPNPVTHILSVDFNEDLANQGFVEIFNMVGQKIVNAKFNNYQNEINLTTFPKGIYLLKIYKDERKVVQQKILKH